MKKHISLILAIIATLCLSMFFVACGDNQGNNPPDEPSSTITVSLNKSNVSMILGSTDNLTAIYTTTDGYALTWSSSDSSVVSVNNGKLEAMKQGSATITASYSNGTDTYSDTANVTVGLGSNAPILCIENFTDSTWNVLKGEAIGFTPYVYFNGMKFYDVAVSVTASNDNIVSFENNTITGLSKGTVDLLIEGEWRGISFNGKNAMSVSLGLNVLSNYEMALNGEAVQDVQLYTRESWGGNTYVTSMAFVPTMKEDNVLSTSEVSVDIENEEVVSYSNGILSYVGFGETKITLSWTSSTGEPYSRVITAFVDRPVDYFESTINYFSAADGAVLYDADGDGKHVETSLVDIIYGVDSDAVLVDAYQTYYNHATKSVIENDPIIVSGELLNGVFSHALGFQDVQLTLGTATEQYIVNVKSASKVFAQDNVDEFVPTFTTSLYQGVGYNQYNADGTTERYEYYWPRYTTDPTKPADWRHRGYYTLCEDISGITSTGKNTGVLFGAHFDGAGHVISDITFLGKDGPASASGAYQYRGGLFGTIKTIQDPGMPRASAIIENVAFTNVTFADDQCALLGYQANGTSGDGHPIVRNIYVEINEQAEYQDGCSVLFFNCQYLDMNNVVIDYPVGENYVLPELGVGGDDTYVFGSFIARNDYAKKASTVQKLEDVYVISSVPLGHCKYDKSDTPELWNQDASNVTADGYMKVNGVYRYNTLAEMKAANNDYSTFLPEYWTIIDGIPVFNALAD